MKRAVLVGREHPLVGAVGAVGEGEAAIALSRGGAPKRYAHTHPNEDAAAFFRGPAGVLLAVADGHSGSEAAEIAVERLVDCGAEWTAGPPEALAGSWAERVRRALFEAGSAIARSRSASRTTLALAVLRPDADLLAYASIGDSHAFFVEVAEATDLAVSAREAPAFLGGRDETLESLGGKCVIGTRSLAGARAVALVTDGLSERGIGVAAPSATVSQVADRVADAGGDRRALDVALGIVEAALAAHRRHGSGDNVAAAVAWLAGRH